MDFTAYIDGACARNGQPNAQGGYGVVILVNGKVVATCSMPLCHCDEKPHTSNLAELRAAAFMLSFIHEYAVFGKPKHDCASSVVGTRIDGRPLSDGASKISLTMYSDSRFVVDGYSEKNKHNCHKAEWNEVMKFKKCLTKNKMKVKVLHVEGHAGNRMNEKADRCARKATTVSDPHDWCEVRCEICGNEYATGESLAVHLKEAHYKSSVRERSRERGVFHWERGAFHCELCTRQVMSKKALTAHMLDKHQVHLKPNGTTVISVP